MNFIRLLLASSNLSIIIILSILDAPLRKFVNETVSWDQFVFSHCRWSFNGICDHNKQICSFSFVGSCIGREKGALLNEWALVYISILVRWWQYKSPAPSDGTPRHSSDPIPVLQWMDKPLCTWTMNANSRYYEDVIFPLKNWANCFSFRKRLAFSEETRWSNPQSAACSKARWVMTPLAACLGTFFLPIPFCVVKLSEQQKSTSNKFPRDEEMSS